jgi:hypothetical protein
MNQRSLLAYLVLALSLATIVDAQVMERSDFVRPKDGLPGELAWSKAIQISNEVRIIVSVEVTGKGNGILELGTKRLRVWDEHDDGRIFVNGLLHVEFVDITGDGYKDLLIFGAVQDTTNASKAPEPLLSIFIYQKDKHEFQLAYKCGPSLDQDVWAREEPSTIRHSKMQ